MPVLSLPRSASAVLLDLLELQDPALYRHGDRVGRFARLTGEAMRLPEPLLVRLELAARLHDLGKLFIPTFLVHKQATLNPEEYRVMQRHALLGAALLLRSPGTVELAEVARHHHEHWDGRGYPSRLRRQEIPLLARITAVADVYDAMTSSRPGGNRGHDEAVGEILRCRGTQFCPDGVDAFLRVEARLEARKAS